MSDGEIRVASEGPMALMQVSGRGTYKLAVGFKSWIEQLVQDTSIRTVMIDVSGATGLDSTFMGLMVTLALQIRKRCALLIVNASEMHRSLLDGIGVSRVWKYAATPVETVTWTSLAEAAEGALPMEGEIRGIIVDAHKTLMAFDERNVPKFKDVVGMLEEETDAVR